MDTVPESNRPRQPGPFTPKYIRDSAAAPAPVPPASVRTAVERVRQAVVIREALEDPAPVVIRAAVVGEEMPPPIRDAVTDSAPPSRITAQELAARLGATPGTDGWFMTCCPAHPDTTPSLGFKAQRFGGILFHDFGGCNPITVEVAMAAKLGVDRSAFASPRIVGQYDYRAADGTLLYQVVRFEPKDFRQRRPDGRGKWEWNLKGITPVPYRLHELQGQERVYVVEGEKDADRLAALGLAATCNSGGASKWKSVHTDALKVAGVREVILLPDRDEPGHQHAHTVAKLCVVKAITPKIVTLPDLPEHGDVSDWLDAGHTVEDLHALVEAARPLTFSRLQEMDAEARAAAPPAPLVLTSMADFYAEPVEALSWVVDDLCSTGGLSLLAGKPKAGKTTLALDLGLSVARGTPWLGRSTTHGTVWLLALEEHRTALKQKLREMGATATDPLFVATAAPRPLEPALEAAMVENPPALIIVDTLYRGLGLLDADDYGPMVEALAPIQRVARESGAHVLLVHHLKKSESESGNDLDNVLGSTAITGGVDTILLLKKTREGTRVLSSEGRYGENLDALTLTLTPTGTVAAGPPPKEAARQSLKARIVEYLRAQRNADGLPVSVEEKDITENVEGRTTEIESTLRWLVRTAGSGVIRPSGTGKKGNPYRYAVNH